jgi:N-carbamoyl-L-amino-acid hydrolase
MTTSARLPSTAIDDKRLLARLDELAAIGSDPSGGVTRLAFSPEELAAKKLLVRWYAEAGLEAGLDAAGNVVAVLRGDGTGDGFLATGSHVDTVVAAGALDGAYGAVAAVEAASVLAGAEAPLRHDVRFVGFSNEEGARGAPGFSGSLAVAGRLSDGHLNSLDDEGVSLAERVRAGGGDPARIAEAAWPAGGLAAFVELHVEQGPVLDACRERLGVVTSCPGRLIVDVELRGVANHAGTTPMSLRADALGAAAEVVLAVEQLAVSEAVAVATTGLLHAEPGVRNVVPGLARLGIDIRHSDDARLAAATEQLASAIEEIGRRRGVETVITATAAAGGVTCDAHVQAAIGRAAAVLDQPLRPMASGAGHDAQIMAALGPVGMIFVPSVGGRSHCPQETTDPADLALGAQLLLAALVELDASVSAQPGPEALT